MLPAPAPGPPQLLGYDLCFFLPEPKQLRERDTKSVGNGVEILQGWVSLSSFNGGEIRHMHARPVSEFFLGESHFLSLRPDLFSERNFDQLCGLAFCPRPPRHEPTM